MIYSPKIIFGIMNSDVMTSVDYQFVITKENNAWPLTLFDKKLLY